MDDGNDIVVSQSLERLFTSSYPVAVSKASMRRIPSRSTKINSTRSLDMLQGCFCRAKVRKRGTVAHGKRGQCALSRAECEMRRAILDRSFVLHSPITFQTTTEGFGNPSTRSKEDSIDEIDSCTKRIHLATGLYPDKRCWETSSISMLLPTTS